MAVLTVVVLLMAFLVMLVLVIVVVLAILVLLMLVVAVVLALLVGLWDARIPLPELRLGTGPETHLCFD